VNGRKAEIATTNIRELAADIGQTRCTDIVQTRAPPLIGNVHRRSEVVNRSAEVIRDEVARARVDMEAV
jgi:hypothetical protein